MKKIKITAFILAVMMIFQMMVPQNWATTGDDSTRAFSQSSDGTEITSGDAISAEDTIGNRTDWLKTLLTMTIKQDGRSINAGGSIDVTKDFEVNGVFAEIPIVDPLDGGEWLKESEYAVFSIDSKVTLFGSPTSLDLEGIVNGTKIKIGALTFETAPGGGLQARIVFEKDLWAEEKGYTDITNITFMASMQYDGSGIGEGEEAKDVTIIGKDFKVYKPVVPIEPMVEKKGVLNSSTGAITWTVTVDAMKGATSGQALKDIVFTDTLTSGITYVDGSFKVGGTSKLDAEVYTSGTKTLNYTFTAADGNGPKAITFDTAIDNWDTVKYGFEASSFTNSAKVTLNGNSASDSDTITITKKTYINKIGERVNSGNDLDRRIFWYIEVNEARHALTNITITDELNSRLDWISAKWQRNTAAQGQTAVWVDVTGHDITTKPTDHRYTYSGTTSDHLRLVMLTEATIKEGDYTTDAETMYNKASVTWDGKPGNGVESGNPGVNVGFHALNKSGSFDTNWIQNHLVNWTVTVDLKEIGSSSIANFKVYDLLVHSSDKGDRPSEVDAAIWSSLTPKYGQKYAGLASNGNPDNLTINPIKVMKGADHVADLIEISGFTTNKAYTVEFSSKMLDPSAFTKNGTVTVSNTATLFDGVAKRKDATADPQRTVEVLKKTVLSATDNEDALNGSTASGSSGNGFNHITRTAIFRLSINSTGQNLSDNEFKGKTDIVVTDTLPLGWEFDENWNTKGYKIFEGSTATVPAVDPVTSKAFGTAGNGKKTATFTFNTLDKHYVILVKARLTDEKYAELVKNNPTSVSQQNDVTLTGNGSSAASNVSVTVNTDVVGKKQSKITNGILKWEIKYSPRVAGVVTNHDKVTLTDTLPAGAELWLDADLNPDTGNEGAEPRFSIKAMAIQKDGSYAVTGDNLAPDWIMAGNVKYDSATRKLTIELTGTQRTAAYHITYLTALVGNPGTIENEVLVEGVTAKKTDSYAQYNIQQSDASAALTLGGWFQIKKVDSNGNAITSNPATFTLYYGDKALRTVTTGADGTVIVRALRPATYTLKETAAPSGFLENSKVYTVTVAEDKTTTVSSGEYVFVFAGTDTSGKFFNVKNYKSGDPQPEYGDLTINKTVAGSDGDYSKFFDFEITLEGLNGTYSYTGNGVPHGTIKNGDVISLAHGHSITIKNLPAGTKYTVAEKDYTVDGYVVTSTGETGAIEANQTQTASFTNSVGKTDVVTKKQGANNLPLSGGTFKISGESAIGSFEAFASAVNGVVTFKDVPVNAAGKSYTIEETLPPSGYRLTGDKLTVTVGYAGSNKTAVARAEFKDDVDTLKNDPIPYDPSYGSISVLKTDEKGTKLQGASFTLYNKAGKALTSAVSGSDGMVWFSHITPGEYVIRETSAPKGYVLYAEDLVVRVSDSATATFTVVNEAEKHDVLGKIEILKTDEAGNVLADAEFRLYDAKGVLIQSGISGKDGLVVFDQVPAGDYTILESRAPQGYELSTHQVTLKVESPETLTVTYVNKRSTPAPEPGNNIKNGSIRIEKIDQDSLPLAGAVFTLFDENGNALKTAVSGTDGLVHFDNLKPGKYTLQEIGAPEGYMLNSDKRIVEVAPTKTLMLKFRNISLTEVEDEEIPSGWVEIDDPEVPKGPGGVLPQAGSLLDTMVMMLMGGGLVLTGMVLLQRRRRKTEKGTIK